MPAFEALNELRRSARRAKLREEELNNPSSVPLHIRKKAKWYRLGYISFVLALIFATLNTPRSIAFNKDGTRNSELTKLAFFLFCAMVSVFLTVQASDPGYIDTGDLVERERLLSNKDETPLSSNKTTLKDKIRGNGHQHETELEIEDAEADAKENESHSSDSEYEESSEESLVLDIEPDENLDIRLSGLEPEKIPIRAKYCRNSKKVVAKYDHYCAIIGTCIGEKNHCRFWWLLFLNTIMLCYGLRIVHSGFRDTKAQMTTWISYNSHALIMAVILWFLLIFFGGLWCFHCFLAMSNMTSYEFMRSDKIRFVPFMVLYILLNNGLFNNLKYFCIDSDGMVAWIMRVEWKPRMWKPIEPINREADNICDNIWENKYYSCC